MKVVVLVEGRTNVEAVTGSKVPIIARVGLVVGEDFVSKGAKWCEIVATGTVELLPGGDVSIQCALAE